MANYTAIRAEALPLIQGRLATLTTLWASGLERAEQQEAMRLEAHRLVSTAHQALFGDVMRLGLVVEQRLKTDVTVSSAPRNARAMIAEALYDLQAAVAQAASDLAHALAQPEDGAGEKHQASDEQPLAGLQVLLVEDSGDLAESFGEGLRLVGCARVVHCGTIGAAQALLARGQPLFDIALIDHNLGRERGATLAVWMRQQPHLAATKRVSYSATARERIVGESADGDFHAVLELRGLRQLIADLVKLAADIPRLHKR